MNRSSQGRSASCAVTAPAEGAPAGGAGFAAYLTNPVAIPQRLAPPQARLPLTGRADQAAPRQTAVKSGCLDEESRKKLLNLIRKGDNLEIVKTLEQIPQAPEAPQPAIRLPELVRGFRLRETRTIVKDESRPQGGGSR